MNPLGPSSNHPAPRRAPDADDSTVSISPAAETDATTISSAKTPPAPPLALGEVPGDRIGPYHLLEKIGEGGFGVVFLAEQVEPIRRRVALKIIKPGMDSKAVLSRFEAERQALALMDHPNIARVLDAGATSQGRPYFVMEHVPGIPITEHCDRHRLTIAQRLDLFATACDAVAHAHTKGIIHRDLKPSNILVAIRDGSIGVPKIIDFGVAKATQMRLTEHTLFTEQGVFIGTPEYMSPEQAEMTAQDIDTRSDVYALGVILYELLTGSLPFDPKSLRAVGYDAMRRIIREVDPPRPSTRLSLADEASTRVADARRMRLDELARELRRELEWIPLKALRKDRFERYRSAMDLGDDVRNYLAGRPLIAGPESFGYRLRKFLRRHKRPVAAGATIVVLLIGGLIATVVLLAQTRRAEHEARLAWIRAQEEADAASEVNEFLNETLSAAHARDRGPRVTVISVLEAGADQIDAKFVDRPRTRIALHSTYANVFRSLGRHSFAERHYRTALRDLDQWTADDRPRRVEILRGLAIVVLELGRDRDAVPLLAEARALSSELPDALGAAAEDRLARGFVAHNQGAYDLAEFHFCGAVALLRGAADRPGRLAEAEDLLARLLIDAGDDERALPLALAALESKRRVFGDKHLSVAFSLLTVGYLHHSQGRIDAAADSYTKAAGLYRELLDDRARPMAVVARFELRGLQEDFGTSVPSAAVASPDASVRLEDLGDMGWIAAVSLRNRGRLLFRLGRGIDAEDRFRRSLEGDRWPGADSRAAHTRRIWAAALAEAGQAEQAESELRRAIALQRAMPEPEVEYSLAPALLQLADLLLRRGRADEALAAADEAVRLHLVDPGEGTWPAALAEAVSASCLLASGRYDTAAERLSAAHRILADGLGDDDKRTRGVAALLAAAARGDKSIP